MNQVIIYTYSQMIICFSSINFHVLSPVNDFAVMRIQWYYIYIIARRLWMASNNKYKEYKLFL